MEISASKVRIAYDYVVVNWKTSAMGLAQFLNGLAGAIQMYQAAMTPYASHDDIKHMAIILARLFAISSILKLMAGLAQKDADRGSERASPIVDAKLDRLMPRG